MNQVGFLKDSDRMGNDFKNAPFPAVGVLWGLGNRVSQPARLCSQTRAKARPLLHFSSLVLF